MSLVIPLTLLACSVIDSIKDTISPDTGDSNTTTDSEVQNDDTATDDSAIDDTATDDSGELEENCDGISVEILQPSDGQTLEGDTTDVKFVLIHPNSENARVRFSTVVDGMGIYHSADISSDEFDMDNLVTSSEGETYTATWDLTATSLEVSHNPFNLIVDVESQSCSDWPTDTAINLLISEE